MPQYHLQPVTPSQPERSLLPNLIWLSLRCGHYLWSPLFRNFTSLPCCSTTRIRSCIVHLGLLLLQYAWSAYNFFHLRPQRRRPYYLPCEAFHFFRYFVAPGIAGNSAGWSSVPCLQKISPSITTEGQECWSRDGSQLHWDHSSVALHPTLVRSERPPAQLLLSRKPWSEPSRWGAARSAAGRKGPRALLKHGLGQSPESVPFLGSAS